MLKTDCIHIKKKVQKKDVCNILKSADCNNCSFYKSAITPYKLEDIIIPDNFRRKSSNIL